VEAVAASYVDQFEGGYEVGAHEEVLGLVRREPEIAHVSAGTRHL
jgi:hypothetical protein